MVKFSHVIFELNLTSSSKILENAKRNTNWLFFVLALILKAVLFENVPFKLLSKKSALILQVASRKVFPKVDWFPKFACNCQDLVKTQIKSVQIQIHTLVFFVWPVEQFMLCKSYFLFQVDDIWKQYRFEKKF